MNWRLLLTARAVSAFGSAFGPIALAYGILADAGATALSVVLACHTVPQLLFVLLGGVLADRFPRGRLLAAAEATAALAWGALALLIAVRAPLAALATAAIVAGLAAAPIGPALTGTVATVVPRDRLRHANSTLRATTHTARILGLAAAGPAVTWLGPAWALAADATTYLLAAAALLAVRTTAAPPAARSLRRDLADGWREFSGRQWLWVLVAAYSFAYAVTAAVTGVLGPLALPGRPATWSAVLAAQAAGTLAGALAARWFRPSRPARAAALLIPLGALPVALLAGSFPPGVLISGACVAGLAAGTLSVLAATVMQQQIPLGSLSRVSAYDWFGSLALVPVAVGLAGPVAGAAGVPAALGGCAVAIAAAGAAALLSPQVRNLRP